MGIALTQLSAFNTIGHVATKNKNHWTDILISSHLLQPNAYIYLVKACPYLKLVCFHKFS